MNMKSKLFFPYLSILLLPVFLQGVQAPPNQPQSPPTLQVQVRPVPLETNGSYNQQPIQGQPRGDIQQTLSIIKPDAVGTSHIGDIIAQFERAGLRIAAIKMVLLNKEQAGQFYQVHRERPFYGELVNFMSSGPVIVMVLEGDNAILKNRQLMGATNPEKAERGTIRANYAESVTRNAVHGSDSPEAAQEEILFFFQPNEIFKRY